MIAAHQIWSLVIYGALGAFTFTLPLFIWLWWDSRRNDRRLNEMRREAEQKRDQDTGAGDSVISVPVAKDGSRGEDYMRAQFPELYDNVLPCDPSEMGTITKDSPEWKALRDAGIIPK